ncbi:hypothetical protein PSTG_14082 [Puccinia striiformis f. sp. tritici PST-78]|uniref:FAR1 domain-containing protein n=1 Tax=Puccinia striiformis f. sp. tritici PST-78 TaxID=1165861 RepID=A0A0L0UZM8_9BASI|nr:hypothetical protein PSTG_14082 [Puccinia striiformis f. sp. tritici PST-78]
MPDSKGAKNEVLDTTHLPSNTIIPSRDVIKQSSGAKEASSKPTGPPSVPEPHLDPFVNKVVDEDLDKEALDLGLEDNKLIEDLDLGIEDNEMIDKCLDLLQSQFGEDDEGDKKTEKEGDNNDAEEGDGNEDYHLQEFPAPPPGNYSEIVDCEEAIKQFAAANCFAIVRKRSTAEKCVHFECDRHVGGTAKSNQSKGDPREPRVTCLCNCTFYVFLYHQSQEKHWKFTVKEPRHNHAPSGSPVAHTANRKLSARLFKEMDQLSDAGLKPARILDALKKLHLDEMILATITTIYSARKKAFADSL